MNKYMMIGMMAFGMNYAHAGNDITLQHYVDIPASEYFEKFFKDCGLEAFDKKMNVTGGIANRKVIAAAILPYYQEKVREFLAQEKLSPLCEERAEREFTAYEGCFLETALTFLNENDARSIMAAVLNKQK